MSSGSPQLGSFPARWAYQCAGGSWFLLYETQVSRGAHTVANWTVDDINAEVADLKARGVEFEHYDHVHDAPTDTDSIERSIIGDAAWFTDPDGNVLGLHQP